MKTYLVGGAVRDMLMGRTPKDHDYVIVGATKKDVEDLIAQGYQRVGADFPVFLHPETGDEYALARTERKVGTGYNGFEAYTSPDLTIEDDLRRRDLTINAIAKDLETGEIIDPFNGQKDLKNGVLRHVSEAFAEDPLRVLRVARFKARYGFLIDPSTMDLMHNLVKSGELDHLTRERVWVEMEKIFTEKNNSAGAIGTLYYIGALDRLFGDEVGANVRQISKGSEEVIHMFENMDVISKFVIFSLHAEWTEEDMQWLKIPREFQKAHAMFQRTKDNFKSIFRNDPEFLLNFIESTDLLKACKVFPSIMSALLFDCRDEGQAVNRMMRVKLIAEAAASVDCGAIAEGLKDGREIAARIKVARLAAIEKVK